jgi:endonuclease/exonuclease/phosphatase family metal-dependent hydrolase
VICRRLLPILPALLAGLAGCVSYELAPQPEVFARGSEYRVVRASVQAPRLRLLTVNLAHGRGTGFHQAFQTADDARRNLDGIEALIRREAPDVIALQEADAASAWSGQFDHVDYLARAADYDWGVHTSHARGIGLSYGTAVLSRLPVRDHAALTFVPARAALPKGFSLATVYWPEAGIELDVISVHMEPLRQAVRQRQASQLVAALADRPRPLVIMGDFNTEWDHEDGVLRQLTDELGLVAYSPEGDAIVTYPRLGRRLDWILVSEPLRFKGFHVLDDEVSDHRVVVADVEVRGAESRPGVVRLDLQSEQEG